MQLQSVLALLGVYISTAIATPVAMAIAPRATDDASVALAQVQHFNGYSGRHCGGAATLVVDTEPDATIAGAYCFSLDMPMHGFIANEPRCMYERFIAHGCSGLSPVDVTSVDCRATINGPWSVRQTCNASAPAVWTS